MNCLPIQVSQLSYARCQSDNYVLDLPMCFECVLVIWILFSRILSYVQSCRSKGVDCIVAPYEADAQLAFLSRSGIAQVIITEDSDLLLFGCERVSYCEQAGFFNNKYIILYLSRKFSLTATKVDSTYLG